MKIAYQVQIGQDKVNCEDHALIRTTKKSYFLNCTKGELEVSLPCVITVADGVGGNPGGYDASKFVVEEIAKYFENGICFDSTEIKDFTESDITTTIKKINSKLVEYAKGIEGKERMATTFSSIFLSESNGILIHVGNTRISVLNNIFIKQLTNDHTTYQWLQDLGNYEATENCNKCEINSCLGGGTVRNLTRLDTKVFYDECQLPKLIIMTSDGIHEFVDLDFLEDVINNESLTDLEKTEVILQEALKNGSEDDKTILIIRK